MKTKSLLFTMIVCFLASVNAIAKEFETVLLNLDCSGFTGNASTDMSGSTTSWASWTKATGQQWTSENCFAQLDTASSSNTKYIGQAVRFGRVNASVGRATTPVLDLRPVIGTEIKLILNITAGANKAGSMEIKLGETTLGSISASTDGDSGSDEPKDDFGAKYYYFEYTITNGTANSQIEFIHSKPEFETGGNLYVQTLKIVRLPVSLIKMDCSAFTTSAITELSTATAPHNWITCIGTALTSSNCHAQNQEASTSVGYLGKCIRLGATAGVGSFSLPELNLLAPDDETKVKLYFEIATGSNDSASLAIKLDGAEMLNVNALTGDNGAPFGTQWYEYDLEITGTASSIIRFEASRQTTNAYIYLRNLRVYYEAAGDDNPSTVISPNEQGAGVSFYPSPFTDYLKVSKPLQSLKIYNTLGQKVADYGPVSSGVPAGHLKSGSYLVLTIDKNGSQQSSVVLKK
jgi:hypothetical protein